jgi:TPR repeat protein/serine/threonine protein kinase
MTSHIGKFELLRPLGRGGMGTVFLGRDPVLGREVAIKTISMGAEGDQTELRQRFLREASLAAKFSHPNLLTIFEFGEQNGILFIAMEFLRGVDLSVLLEKQLLGPRTLLELLAQVADGLSEAHFHGVIHRDIKPQNIRVLQTPRGLHAKIMDFGIARSRMDGHMTQTGAVLGTPYYTAPEVLKGGVPDPRADLWAVGVVLYQALSGKRAFEGDTPALILMKVLTEHPKLDTVPGPLRLLVATAIEKDPDRRYQTAADLAAALRERAATLPAEPLFALPKELLGEDLPAPMPTEPVSPSPAGASPGPAAAARVPSVITEETAPQPAPKPWLDPGADASILYQWGLKFMLGDGLAVDPVSATSCFRKAADGGHLEAMHQLGELLLSGESGLHDTQEALLWTRKAASAGSPDAMARLGVELLKTPDRRDEGLQWLHVAAAANVPLALKTLARIFAEAPPAEGGKVEAARILRAAAALDEPTACYALGRWIRSGFFAAEDPGEVRHTLARAADLGMPEAMIELAEDYRGEGATPQDRATAAEWLQKAAWKGHGKGILAMARAYRDGDGVPANPAQAASLFRQAAELGDPEAMLARAWSVYEGVGVRAEPLVARDWFHRAAEAGCAEAYLPTAKLYTGIEGLYEDRPEALKWFHKAFEAGYDEAAFHIGRLLEKLGDEAAALPWIQKGAEKGNPEALTALGRRHREGRGVAKDEARAGQCLRRAAEGGDLAGMVELADLLLHRQMLRPDPPEALRWLRRAAEAGHTEAMARLYRLLDKGVPGLAPNKAEAEKWRVAAGLPEEKMMNKVTGFFGWKSE